MHRWRGGWGRQVRPQKKKNSTAALRGWERCGAACLYRRQQQGWCTASVSQAMAKTSTHLLRPHAAPRPLLRRPRLLPCSVQLLPLLLKGGPLKALGCRLWHGACGPCDRRRLALHEGHLPLAVRHDGEQQLLLVAVRLPQALHPQQGVVGERVGLLNLLSLLECSRLLW